jgi:hypothetical protein
MLEGKIIGVEFAGNISRSGVTGKCVGKVLNHAETEHVLILEKIEGHEWYFGNEKSPLILPWFQVLWVWIIEY